MGESCDKMFTSSARTLLVTVVVFATASIAAKFFNSFAGPYIIVVERWYDCPLGEEGYDGSISHHVRYSHFNPLKRTEMQKIWGNETRSVTLNDTYWRIYNASIWRNNEWKINWIVMKIPTAGCSATRVDEPHYFRRLGGVVINGTCSMPPGTFDLRGNAISNDTPDRIPILPYGRYRFRLTYGIGTGKPIPYCAYMEVQLIPK